MTVDIDPTSGFCFGVRRAIATAEELLATPGRGPVHCVGDIVHNEREIERLRGLGLHVVSAGEIGQLSSGTVLFRAHGEPPGSYRQVESRHLALTDATCPVVLALQRRIREAHERQKACGGQVVLFGKRGHAEVIGLMGQTRGEGILVEDAEQACQRVDPARSAELFAQTTMNPDQYDRVAQALTARPGASVTVHHTICRQMAARADLMADFARQHDVILFVGGAKSSNSKVLFDICRRLNPRSHFVGGPEELQPDWCRGADTVGILGATSTPLWLMERVREAVQNTQQ